MKKYAIPALIALLLFSCNSGKQDETLPPPAIDSNVVNVDTDDMEMNQAIYAAQQTLYRFDSALQLKNDSLMCMLKARFPVRDGGGEHIWLYDIHKTSSGYRGVLDDDPVYPEIKHKMNDTITVSKNDISDWMFVKDSQLVGGFTTRVLYKRMTKEERKSFDDNMPYRVTE